MKNIASIYSETFQGMIKSANTSWKVLLVLLCMLSSHANAEEKPAAGGEKQAAVSKQPAIGKVISTVGKAKAVKPDKTERTLNRGDTFYALETILTDAASKIQLKFLDGAIINLIASTEYRVDSYVFKDPKEKNGTLSTLAKGGYSGHQRFYRQGKSGRGKSQNSSGHYRPARHKRCSRIDGW